MMDNCSLPRGFTPPHLLSGLPEASPVLLAYSGGPDSSALLYMLAQSCRRYGAPLFAAHVDHRIRTGENVRDREFCRETAKRLGIELFVLEADIPAISEQTGESPELAARRVRYEFFSQIMQSEGIPQLATAHTADDNLETVIFNLVRGTGLRGLCGIPVSRPTDGGVLVRPVLGMTKDEILGFCNENRIGYVTDSTNADPSYSRNRIRLEVVPALRTLNGGAAHTVSGLCGSLGDDAALLDSLTEEFLTANRDGDGISLTALNSAPPSIRSRALLSLCPGLERTHITSLVRLCEACVPHSSVSLPGRLRAVIENGRLTVLGERPHGSAESDTGYETALSPGINRLPCGMSLTVTDKAENIYKSAIHAIVASDTINGILFARTRRPGDRILMKGMSKSVRKLMNEKKLPLGTRDSLPLVCDGGGILWIPCIGLRDGATAKNQENKKLTYIVLETG